MKRSGQAAIVFSGDGPGQWWVVHAAKPRFAARLISAEEFNADARYAGLVPQGINPGMPVHFAQGADVLVITDFIDPIDLTESDSPQKAILSDAMIEALHTCEDAVSRRSDRDSAFAPLSDQAEQFLVGWTALPSAADVVQLRHLSGARVRVHLEDDGACEATLEAMPPEGSRYGWNETVLRDRLERVAGERGLLLRMGQQWLHSETGSELTDGEFVRVLKRQPQRLQWGLCESTTSGGDAVRYAALRLVGDDGGRDEVFPTEVELDASSSLNASRCALDADDARCIEMLLPAYGLASAVNLRAAFRFACFLQEIDAPPRTNHLAAVQAFPCEVELATAGELYAAVLFAPPDGQGVFRAVIAPHGPTSALIDPASLLPFECVTLRREQFHLPRYAGATHPV